MIGQPHVQVCVRKDLWIQYKVCYLQSLPCTQKGVNLHLLKCNVIIIHPLKIVFKKKKKKRTSFHSIIHWQSALGIEWFKLKRAVSLTFLRVCLLVYVFNDKPKVWQMFTATASIQNDTLVKITLSKKILICKLTEWQGCQNMFPSYNCLGGYSDLRNYPCAHFYYNWRHQLVPGHNPAEVMLVRIIKHGICLTKPNK